MAGEPAPEFAGLLRRLRSEAGLTQEELAQAAEVSPRTVSDLERGLHRSAHRDTAGLLADALGLAGPARALFVAAARGRASAAEVLAARRHAPAVLAAVAAEHPAAATATVPRDAMVPRELPADVDAFTGRARELAELDLLLPRAHRPAASPVVISAVSGTAGVGKTALAVRWAHQVSAEFPDGQLYVNLRGYDPDKPVPSSEALAGFLHAMGVSGQDIPPGDAERSARYRSVVAGKRMLVLLDNAATVEQVRPLLPGASTVMVLVTSRDSLAGLVARDGARRLDLNLLPTPDAVALLRTLIRERAEAEPAAAELLAKLCARLPLALRVAAELAVARPGVPLAELAAELASEGERLDLLDAGGDPRGAVASVFSWSYRHLSAEAATLFRLLGLHPGASWDRYAAAALSSDSVPRTGQLLNSLARAHLIQPAGRGRYGMHDLLRAYAAGLATALDDDQVRREALTRLFDYYLAACAAAMDSYAPAEHHHRPDPPAVGALVPDLGDRAAARAWLDAELAAVTAVAAHTCANGWPGHAIRLAATLHRYLDGGHYAEGITIHTHALNAARDSGDQAGLARALISLAGLHSRQGEYQQAAACDEQALALAADIGDRRLQSRALSNLAVIYSRQSRYQQALGLYQQALTIDRELGDQLREVVQLGNLGLLHLRQGRYQQAADHQHQALALFRTLGDQLGEANTLTILGEVCHRQGHYQQAAGYQQQALAMSRETGDRRIGAWALTRLGEVGHRQGHYDQAADHHQQALELFREIGDREGEADALNGTGETLLATGQPTEAYACHTAALTVTRRTGDRYQQARALTGLGEVCHRQGHHAGAAGHYHQALLLYQEIGAPGGEADVLNGAGESLFAAGQAAEAQASHAAALDLARTTGDRFQQARAHQGLAAVCQATGRPGEARQHRQDALGIYTGLGVPEADRLRGDAAGAGEPYSSSGG